MTALATSFQVHYGRFHLRLYSCVCKHVVSEQPRVEGKRGFVQQRRIVHPLLHVCAGLAENRCLERTDCGAKLLQVGQQDVAMGFKFKARVVLDIGEHMNGLRAQLLSDDKVCMLYHTTRALLRAWACSSWRASRSWIHGVTLMHSLARLGMAH